MITSDVMRNIGISELDERRAEVYLTSDVMRNIEIGELDERRYTKPFSKVQVFFTLLFYVSKSPWQQNKLLTNCFSFTSTKFHVGKHLSHSQTTDSKGGVWECD